MAKKFKFRYVNEIVGGFVLLVVLLLLAGILVAGNAQHWFDPMVEISLKFPKEGSLDLQKSAEVMLKGTKVGSVQDILVDDAGNITGSIRVRGSFMRFVRQNTVAWVKKKMVVTGDAFIELRGGWDTGLALEAETNALLRVVAVRPDSPAAAAGIRPGEWIVRVAGADVRPGMAVKFAMEKMSEGDVPELELGVAGADGEIRAVAVEREMGRPLPAEGAEIPCEKDTEILQMLEEKLDVLTQEAENTLRLVNSAIEQYTLVAENLNDPQGHLQQILANVNGLLDDVRKGEGLPAKVLNDPAMAKDVESIVSEVQKLLVKINAMAADLQASVAKLSPAVDTLSGEVDNLPVVVGDAQALMRETTALLEGLQKHWLLKKYMGSDDAVRSGEVLVP